MEVKLHNVQCLECIIILFNTIILNYVLVLGSTIFTLFVPYLGCICIFYVIWQLNALNGFSFHLLIYVISAINKKIF